MGNNSSSEIYFTPPNKLAQNPPVKQYPPVKPKTYDLPRASLKRQPSYALPENRVLPRGLPDPKDVKLRSTRKSLPENLHILPSERSGSDRGSSHSSNSRRPLSMLDENTFRKIYDTNDLERGTDIVSNGGDDRQFLRSFSDTSNSAMFVGNKNKHARSNSLGTGHVHRTSSVTSKPLYDGRYHRKSYHAPAPPPISTQSTPSIERGRISANNMQRSTKKFKAPEPPGPPPQVRLYRKNSKNNRSSLHATPIQSTQTTPTGARKKKSKAPQPPGMQQQVASPSNERQSIRGSLSEERCTSKSNKNKPNWESTDRGNVICRIEPKVRPAPPPVEPPIDYENVPVDEISAIEEENESPPKSPIRLIADVHNSINGENSASKPASTKSSLSTPDSLQIPELNELDQALNMFISDSSVKSQSSTGPDTPSAPASTAGDEIKETLVIDILETSKLTRQVSLNSENSEGSNKSGMRRLNSLLQHDIVRAAQARPSKPITIKQDYDRPKSLQQLFENELSQAYENREKRRESGDLKTTPVQEPVRFSAKLGRVVSKSELNAIKEKETNAKSYPGAEGLLQMFNNPNPNLDAIDSIPNENETDNSDFDAMMNSENYRGSLSASGSYKKNKSDKGKFNSLRKIKKSVRNAIGSLGRASARLHLTKQRKTVTSVFEDADTNWSLGPGVASDNWAIGSNSSGSIKQHENLNSHNCEEKPEDFLSWKAIDININESESENRETSALSNSDKEIEEGIVCYDNKGQMVIIPQCEIVKIVKKHTAPSGHASEMEENDNEQGNQTFVYKLTKIGENKVAGEPDSPEPTKNIDATAALEEISNDKGNFVLVPREQLDKMINTNQKNETTKEFKQDKKLSKKSKKKGKDRGDSDEEASPPPSLVPANRHSESFDSDEEKPKVAHRKKGKKIVYEEKSKKGKKKKNVKYVYIDESDDDDSETEIIEVRRGRQKSVNQQAIVNGFHGNPVNGYSQGGYPPLQPNGYPNNVVNGYPAVQMNGFHGNMINGYHGNIMNGYQTQPPVHMKGYPNPHMSGYPNPHMNMYTVAQINGGFPVHTNGLASSDSDNNQDNGLVVSSSPSTTNGDLLPGENTVQKSASSTTVESSLSADTQEDATSTSEKRRSLFSSPFLMGPIGFKPVRPNLPLTTQPEEGLVAL